MRIITKSLLTSIWFMFLTFPLVVVKVDSYNNKIIWRWENMALMGAGIFALSLAWAYSARLRSGSGASPLKAKLAALSTTVRENYQVKRGLLLAILAVLLIMPWVSSPYQTNIMISAMLYAVLGLGLNIVVGISGQLMLGYAAFYAVGAYTYAILNSNYAIGFWAALPLGGISAVIFGILLGLPVLRLKGDYLAIVTLGFGEIVRLVLENWGELSGGPSGISNISRPSFFGIELSVSQTATYIYYLMMVAIIITIIAVTRLKNSRIGLALQAMREDDIACEAMGIDLMRTKLAAFALGACWAGFAGVVFAAKTTFINPASFTFMESAMILSIVVLGGMGSVVGVILAAFVLILAPEYLRAFSEYRMLIFGAIMVLMMIFRPQGLIVAAKRKYKISGNIMDKGNAS